jgi:hypothetical protein
MQWQFVGGLNTQIFLLQTCNAKWHEIQYMIDQLNKKQKPADRAEVVVRVFMIKLKQLLQDISKHLIFGETLAGEFYFMNY